MTIAREFLSDTLIDEMQNYFGLGYKAYNDDEDLELDPNWDTYKALQDSNLLFIFTVRDGSKLVGYAWYIAMPSLHSKSTIFAAADTIYLDKDYRGRFLGIKLFKYAEEVLKENKITLVLYSVKVYENWGKLLERLGYKQSEVTYQKRI